MKEEEKEKNTKNRSGWILLGVVVGLYIVTFVLDSSTGKASALAALNTLKIIAPIMLIVFFLMALLNTFLNPKKIAKHLGEESGLKGYIIAITSGVLSHGPGYIWYPLLSDLRKQGTRDGLIVAFFYVRSIKLPWLPLMVSYFGFTFTVLLTLFTITGAWIQGIIVNLFNAYTKKERDETE